jgi:hypothetical protein
MNRLQEVVLDLERHAAAAGWDAAPQLYALVQGDVLRRQEPALADELGVKGNDIAALEQPPMDTSLPSVEDALGTIVWPDLVSGCALVIERLMLPPEVEAEIPEDEDEALAFVTGHPQREEVRMVVAVLRDGTRHTALRLRQHDDENSVLTGVDLVPALANALAETLEPDEEED